LPPRASDLGDGVTQLRACPLNRAGLGFVIESVLIDQAIVVGIFVSGMTPTPDSIWMAPAYAGFVRIRCTALSPVDNYWIIQGNAALSLARAVRGATPTRSCGNCCDGATIVASHFIDMIYGECLSAASRATQVCSLLEGINSFGRA